jgi:iron(III) transport system permease protein
MNALHLYPILYLNIAAALANLDPAMEQAAENLGCPPWKRFFRITLPLAMPGVFAGTSIVFIWAFTELGVPLVFDFARVAPVQIFDGLKGLDKNPIPYALTTVLLIVAAAVFAMSKWVIGRSPLRTPAESPRYRSPDQRLEVRSLQCIFSFHFGFGDPSTSRRHPDFLRRTVVWHGAAR